MGLQAYNLFNHTEGGFPNINVHYPLPWFESGEGLANWCLQNPQKSFYNLVRKMEGSMGDDAGSRFVNPYDAGMGYLVKFNHDFIGREALEEIAKAPKRTCVTLEWNPDDVGKVYAAFITPGGESVDDISRPSSNDIAYCSSHGCMVYHQDKVIKDGRELGFTSGRIISYNYHAMISLAFIDSDEAVEGSEVTILWGTPGTKQMEVRAKVAPFPYNKHDIISNQDKDVEEIPHPVLP
jgi:glycine cleavage system aminomethyltransferase T